MNDLTFSDKRVLKRHSPMKFGTSFTGEGVRFRLWAPCTQAVSLRIHDLDATLAMTRQPRDWYEVEVPGAKAGMLYHFVLDDGTEVPDPASRFQPDDVDGPSEIIDPHDFNWTDVGWQGRPWEEQIIYELHVGTFTEEGTFRGVMDRLDDLVDLGVTALELMPIADFPGRWNWGYDGANLFAPDATYGRPDDLKALIDAAHARGLCVYLDVVYNHFGPKGNYMSIYAPVVTDKHKTPWGPAVNFDDEGSAGIRDFITANARYWLNEYHFDGLRFDAVHEIRDSGPRHMLQDLAEQLRASTDGRHIHLMEENSDNEAGWLKRRDDGSAWLYDAQWSDDIHHALHATITGEDIWYYADFKGRIDLVGRALAEGLAWQGEYMEHEKRTKGEPSTFLPATAFVSYAQNHDQTGNRPFGERISHLAPEPAVRLWAAINLLSPQIPLLFMGEEWAATQTFPFFSDVGEDLAEAIRASRREELESYPPREDGAEPPDPMAQSTFEATKLNWSERDEGVHQRFLSHYRALIALRKREIIPLLPDMKGHAGHYEVLGESTVRVTWRPGGGAILSLLANLSAEPFHGTSDWDENPLWVEGKVSGRTLGGWSAIFTLTH